jgi:hypothetical protein
MVRNMIRFGAVACAVAERGKRLARVGSARVAPEAALKNMRRDSGEYVTLMLRGSTV